MQQPKHKNKRKKQTRQNTHPSPLSKSHPSDSNRK